jgi:hypothetical protein
MEKIMLFEETIKLPLNMEQLQKVLALKGGQDQTANPLQQDLMCVVDYANSGLKGINFINYVANLRLSIDVDSTGLSSEDKKTLLKDYLSSRMLSEIHNLAVESMLCLLSAKDGQYNEDFFLQAEERKEFISENSELIQKFELFLESILIGLPFCIKDYANSVGKELVENKIIEVVNDPAFISSNVVSMIVAPDFLEAYLSLPLKHQPKLFDSQWFEPVFNGFSLISIISNHSSFFPFMQSMYEGWFTEEEIKQAI